MLDFIEKALEKALDISGINREELAYKVLPKFFLEIINSYLRVEVEGAQHIPKKEPYLVIANHSGYMGFDALMLAHQIYQLRKRAPKIIAHKLWFLSPEISVHTSKLGLVPANYENGLKVLENKRSLLLFPEGEEGNFKPTRFRYRLRKFRRGFVRLALTTGVPIVPAVVIGAEETHITLSQIRWAKEVVGIIVPVPLNVFPLPARWKIKFLPPIKLEKDPEKAKDITYVSKVSREVRRKLQKSLHTELKDRKFVFV